MLVAGCYMRWSRSKKDFIMTWVGTLFKIIYVHTYVDLKLYIHLYDYVFVVNNKSVEIVQLICYSVWVSEWIFGSWYLLCCGKVSFLLTISRTNYVKHYIKSGACFLASCRLKRSVSFIYLGNHDLLVLLSL